MKKFFLTALLMILAAVPSTVNAAVYQQGVVYVIYDETGEDALQNTTDLNANGVPDMVENVATQVNAARELFHEVLNFPDPLKSERYKDVTCIEIDLKPKSQMTRPNGKVYTGMAFNKVRKAKHDPNKLALHFKIIATLNPSANPTPTHEYFHLIQYSTTYFTNKWYLEGMARWSQDAVVRVKEYPDGQNIPQVLNSEEAENEIFEGSYNTSKLLWYPLAVNMNDRTKIPSRLMNKYKYVNGKPVFHDDIFYGPNVMLKVLKTMRSTEEISAQAEGLVNRREWHKKIQREGRTNRIIMDCVREVYRSKNR